MKIHLRNSFRTLDAEKSFLEKQHLEGLKFKHLGWMFYHFTETSPKKVVYEIDLLPKAWTKEEAVIEGWNLITTNPLWGSAHQKAYYLNENPEEQLVTDMEAIVAYYKKLREICAFLTFCLCPAPAILLAINHFGIPIPPELYLLSLPLILLGVLLFFHAARVEENFHQIVREQGEERDPELVKIWYFAMITAPEMDESDALGETLSVLGRVRSLGKGRYAIHSYLGVEEIFNRIKELAQINESQLQMGHSLLGGLYRGDN